MIKGFSDWRKYSSINEALPLPMAKRYAKIQRSESVQKRLDKIIDLISSLPGAKHSKRKERVYLPFDSDTEFTSSDFRTRSKIEEILKSSGFTLKDYKNGIVIDNFGRQIKIGKALVKLNRPDLAQAFNADPIRVAAKSIDKNMILVFSKSSYDIAGMSTDREWDSCMNVFTGGKNEYVACDIEQGSFICYLTSSDDENLKSPIARILIKPYQNVADRSEIIYVPDPIYGNAPYNFYGQVEDILVKVQQEKSESFYQLLAALNQENQIRIRKGLMAFSKKEGFLGTISRKTREIIDDGKIVTSKQEIAQILDELLITNYKINDDLTVDVDGDVDMATLGLKRLPFRFGEVTGKFDCSNNKKLQTLEGSPRIVGGDFLCADCGLATLKGAPDEVQGDSFQCHNNRLTNLEHLPKLTGSDIIFSASENKLESLKGCPTAIHTFYCDGNKLKSLEGAPKKTVAFHCSNNDLTDFSSGISASFSFTCLNNRPTLDETNKDLIKKLISSVKCNSYEIGTDDNRIMIGDNNNKVWYIDRKENKNTTMVKKFSEWMNESLHSGVPVDFFKKIHQYSKKRPLDIQADITDDLINNDLEDVSHHFYELGTNPPEEED